MSATIRASYLSWHSRSTRFSPLNHDYRAGLRSHFQHTARTTSYNTDIINTDIVFPSFSEMQIRYIFKTNLTNLTNLTSDKVEQIMWPPLQLEPSISITAGIFYRVLSSPLYLGGNAPFL